MHEVNDFSGATPETARAWFSQLLRVETDCADVHAVLNNGSANFVLLQVSGSQEAWTRRHIPGAVWLPHGQIDARRMAQWPASTRFVVYCAGPHCNAADQAALKLAQLGYPVKKMIGGLAGWAWEGFGFASDDQEAGVAAAGRV